MSESPVPRLVRLHARLIGEAGEAEAAAARGGRFGQPTDDLHDAMEARANAEALAELLCRMAPEVARPDPRQLSLLADGGPS